MTFLSIVCYNILSISKEEVYEQATIVSACSQRILLGLRHLYKGIYEGHAQSNYDMFGVYWHWVRELLFNGALPCSITPTSPDFSKVAFIAGLLKAFAFPDSTAIPVPAQ